MGPPPDSRMIHVESAAARQQRRKTHPTLRHSEENQWISFRRSKPMKSTFQGGGGRESWGGRQGVQACLGARARGCRVAGIFTEMHLLDKSLWRLSDARPVDWPGWSREDWEDWDKTSWLVPWGRLMTEKWVRWNWWTLSPFKGELKDYITQ